MSNIHTSHISIMKQLDDTNDIHYIMSLVHRNKGFLLYCALIK